MSPRLGAPTLAPGKADELGWGAHGLYLRCTWVYLSKSASGRPSQAGEAAGAWRLTLLTRGWALQLQPALSPVSGLLCTTAFFFFFFNTVFFLTSDPNNTGYIRLNLEQVHGKGWRGVQVPPQ